jgi:4-aminobutyrate aminotransferase-like enzyme
MSELTPNLQEALAVQQLMRDNTRDLLSAIPLVRHVRGSGAAAIDTGTGQVTAPSPNDFGTATINHGLGLLPTLVLVTPAGPAPFGSFHGCSLMAYSWTATNFIVEVQCPGYTGGVVVSFSWLVLAVQI